METAAGVLVREARTDSAMTQRALAEAVGLRQSNIAAIEAGTRPISAEKLERLLSAADYRPSLALARHADELIDLGMRYGVRDLRVFGSVARGDDHHSSDIDLLVDVDADRSYLDIGAFASHAQELLGFPVDVVIDSGGRPGMEHIRATAVAL